MNKIQDVMLIASFYAGLTGGKVLILTKDEEILNGTKRVPIGQITAARIGTESDKLRGMRVQTIIFDNFNPYCGFEGKQGIVWYENIVTGLSAIKSSDRPTYIIHRNS